MKQIKAKDINKLRAKIMANKYGIGPKYNWEKVHPFWVGAAAFGVAVGTGFVFVTAPIWLPVSGVAMGVKKIKTATKPIRDRRQMKKLYEQNFPKSEVFVAKKSGRE